MSQLKEQYERETGKCWHLNHQTYLLPAEGYVNWLEAKVENGSSHNTGSPKLPGYGPWMEYAVELDLSPNEADKVYKWFAGQLRAGA